jgi:O-antigen ligase
MVSVWLQIEPQRSADQLLDGSPLDRNILTGLLAVGLLVLLRRRERVGQLLRANRPIILFFVYCAISTLWSDYPYVAFKRWIKACGDFAMVLIVLSDPDRSAAIRRLLARVGFLLVPLSILFIKYYPDLGRYYDAMTGEPSVSGVTTGKNLLGMVCLISGLGALWRLVDAFRGGEGSRRMGPLAAQGVLLAMVAWLFWQANSMTSLSCFLLATGLMVTMSLPTLARRPSLAHLLSATVLCVSASVLFFDVGGGALVTMGRDPTLTGRTGIWDVTLRFAANPFFGAGFESFWLGERLLNIWNIYPWHPNQAHNGYLEIFLNLGWVGMALFAFVIATGYRNVVGALRQDRDAGAFRLAYFIAVLVYNFTEAVSRTFTPIWVLYLLATLAIPERSALAATTLVVEPRIFTPEASVVTGGSRKVSWRATLPSAAPPPRRRGAARQL